MKLLFDKLELDISKSFFGKVNVVFDGSSVYISGSKKRVIKILKENYERIKAHYISNLSPNLLSDINNNDLNTISVKILIYYLDQYTRWKKQYRKSNYDIKFNDKDFDHPSTHDLIIFYLKDKYPDKWKIISEKYINMTTKEFEFYWTNRIAYFNK